jgi:hypothetical protein
MGNIGTPQQCLGGYAAPVQTDTAQMLLFNQGGFKT